MQIFATIWNFSVGYRHVRCFRNGEMKLGQIDGVVRTEAGYFKGREVTSVEYAPERVALEELARQAKQAGVADIVHLDAETQRAPAGVSNGSPLDKSYRPAPADDQKKQIKARPLPVSSSHPGKRPRSTHSPARTQAKLWNGLRLRKGRSSKLTASAA